jgi:hypothetical protein
MWVNYMFLSFISFFLVVSMHDYYVSFVCFIFYILGIGELRAM